MKRFGLEWLRYTLPIFVILSIGGFIFNYTTLIIVGLVGAICSIIEWIIRIK